MIGNLIELTNTGQVRLIAEKDYSTEYMKKNALFRARLRIKHTVESQKVNGKAIDRHNITLSRDTFAQTDVDTGATFPAQFAEATIIIRCESDGDSADVIDMVADLAEFVSTNSNALVGWES